MSAKEIIIKLIHKIGFSKSILSSNKNKFYSAVPGEVIASLSEEERLALQNLTSKDILDVSREWPVDFFCDKYYEDKEKSDQVRYLKNNFDRKIFIK